MKSGLPPWRFVAGEERGASRASSPEFHVQELVHGTLRCNRPPGQGHWQGLHPQLEALYALFNPSRYKPGFAREFNVVFHLMPRLAAAWFHQDWMSAASDSLLGSEVW